MLGDVAVMGRILRAGEADAGGDAAPGLVGLRARQTLKVSSPGSERRDLGRPA